MNFEKGIYSFWEMDYENNSTEKLSTHEQLFDTSNLFQILWRGLLKVLLFLQHWR